MNLFKNIPLFLCILAETAFLVGCSSSGKSKMKHTEWCRIRYEGAEELFKKEKYGRATDRLEEILSTCAGTGYMEQAQFLMAESYFNMEDWIADEPFDGIWCCASLIHLNDEEQARFFRNLDRNLKPGGALFLSVKDGAETGRDSDGVFTDSCTEAELRKYLDEKGLI